MITVICSPTVTSTWRKWSLASLTLNVIHPDWIWSLTIRCTMTSGGRAGEATLTTHHVCVIHIPKIITHCAPLPFIINFNSARVYSTAYQANTRAPYTSVITVRTTIVSPSTVTAVIDMWLAPWACYVIHPYGTGSLTMSYATVRVWGVWETELLAQDVGVIYSPAMMTYGTPLIVVEDFDSTSWQSTPSDTDASFWDNY